MLLALSSEQTSSPEKRHLDCCYSTIIALKLLHHRGKRPRNFEEHMISICSKIAAVNAEAAALLKAAVWNRSSCLEQKQLSGMEAAAQIEAAAQNRSSCLEQKQLLK